MLNTAKNPDILIQGGNFLKGNKYFKDVLVEAKEEDREEEELSDEMEEQIMDQLAVEDNAFDKMKKMVNRYYIEENPTLKCRNCL